ncbi:acetyl-CoA carboxylase, carboxyltransferase subunit beta [bacterium]
MATLEQKDAKKSVPNGVWEKCPNCDEIIYTKELQTKFKVCQKCKYHFRIGVYQRLDLLVDEGTFVEFDANIQTDDPLEFKDLKTYKERIKLAREKTGRNEAVLTGSANIGGKKICIGVMDFAFMGGSMGSVVGEKITRLIEKAIEIKVPVIIVSSSGGARMQESMFSLMQMAKTTAALAKLSENKLPYISILTDPTTGGVSASFAMLGDINIAEKGALIAFAGPRVIEQTIRQKLPEGFQRAEFLLEHGMIDIVISREELKDVLDTILDMFITSPITSNKNNAI